MDNNNTNTTMNVNNDTNNHHEAAYFQRLSLSASLNRTFEIYKSGFWIFSQIAALLIAVFAITWALALLFLLPAFDVQDQKFQDPEYLMDHIGAYNALLAIRMLFCLVFGAISSGAMIRAVADVYLERPPSFKTCADCGKNNFFTILGASLLSFLAVFLGYICLLAPGIYLSGALMLVNPAIVIEGMGAMASLKRSMNLVSGNWCYVFCTFMVLNIIIMIVNMVWQLVFNVGTGQDANFSIIGSILSTVPLMINVPIISIMLCILYFNLRIEKEGFNKETLVRNLGDAGDNSAPLYSPLNAELREEEDVGV